MSFSDNPRGWLLEQLYHGLTGGLKAFRYLLSPRYRKRVREHWQRYPQLRRRGIARMIVGILLLMLVLLTTVLWFHDAQA